jgi:hypothetical protein
MEQLLVRQRAAEDHGHTPLRAVVLMRTPGFIDPADGLWTNPAQNWLIQRGAAGGTGDVAILKIAPIPKDGPLQPLRLSLADIREGQPVATSGYPHGSRMPMNDVASPTFTSGIVSAVSPNAWALPGDRTELVMDAMILGGNSGGPVFDVETGGVIGLVARNYRPEYRIPHRTGDTVVPMPLSLSFIEPAHLIQFHYQDARQAWSGDRKDETGDNIISPPANG